jgi:hypothetical protein
MLDGQKAGVGVAAVAATAIGGFVAHDASLIERVVFPLVSDLKPVIGGEMRPATSGASWIAAESSGESVVKFRAGQLSTDADEILNLRTPLQVPRFIVPQDFHQAAVVNGLIDDAQPQILNDLAGMNGNITVEEADKIIKAHLAEVATAKSEQQGSAMRFTVSSGELHVESAYRLAGVEVNFGSINLYKVAAGAAVTIAACNGLSAPGFQECVNMALQKATHVAFGGGSLPSVDE